MREIKFKGKRADNGDWVIGSLVMVCDGESLRRYPCIVISFNHDVFDWHEVIPDTVGQFTGLTDKNGKEIFEGDILKISWLTPSTGGYFQSDDAWCENEVIVRVDSVGDRFVYVKKDGKQTSIKNGSTVEIIGNIHDNPELILDS